MASYIEGKRFFTIKINDEEVTSASNFVREVILQEGQGLSGPVAKLTLVDKHQILTGPLALTDGSALTIEIGKSVDEFEEFKLSVFKIDHQDEAGSDVLTVWCIAHMPTYLQGACREYYEDNSSEALSKIASASGIDYDGPDSPTSDKMVWNNCGTTRAQHAEEIASKAYSDESASWKLLVGFDGMKFKDTFSLFDEEPAYIFSFNYTPKDAQLDIEMITESAPESASGVMNSLTNYGHTHVQSTLTKGDDIKLESVSPAVLGEGLALNVDIKNSMDATNFTTGEFWDVGIDPLPGSNMHENYYKAAYQNMRHNALFTETVKCLSPGYIGAKLFSVVDYYHGDESGPDGNSLNTRYSGKYLVFFRTLILRGAHFAEVYDLYRSYITKSGNTPVEGGTADNPNNIVKETNADDIQSPSSSVPGVNTSSKSVSKDTLLSRVGNVKSQVNSKIAKGIKGTQSAFDKVVAKMQSRVDDLEIGFKQQGEQFNFPSLSDKYGTQFDKMDALMSEFQSAVKTLDACSALSDLEKLSLDATIENKSKLLGSLYNKLNSIDEAIDNNTRDVNNLIASGDIPASYLNSPEVKVKCAQRQAGQLQEALNDALPDQCLDRHAFDQLNAPGLNLKAKMDKIVNQIKSILCAIDLKDS